MAATGLLLFLMSLFGLPWVSANGQDANFPDIRKAWENADAIEATPVAYTASPTAPTAPSDTDYDYLELYVEWGWVMALVFVASAVLVATILVPTSLAARVVIGCLTFGVIGAVIMALDKEGTAGPKVCGVLLAGIGGAAHLYAIRVMFDGSGSDPAYGVWIGVVGLALVVIGSIIGTRTERVATGYPAYR